MNRIRTPLTAPQSSGLTNTIRAKVRWLRGHPEILRLRGNWHEAAVAMDLPTNLGTPGARNSRAVNNAPPAISMLRIIPLCPLRIRPSLSRRAFTIPMVWHPCNFAIAWIPIRL